jgi:hypothetical protein
LADLSHIILARFIFHDFGHTVFIMERARTLEEWQIGGTIHLVLRAARQLFCVICILCRTLIEAFLPRTAQAANFLVLDFQSKLKWHFSTTIF